MITNYTDTNAVLCYWDDKVGGYWLISRSPFGHVNIEYLGG